MGDPGQKYKIKLSSGRILGPIDLHRIALLISKNQVVGNEVAREYPQGDWKEIQKIPELAELLLSHLSGKKSELPEKNEVGLDSTRVFASDSKVVPAPPKQATTVTKLPDLQTIAATSGLAVQQAETDQEDDHTVVEQAESSIELDDQEKTKVATNEEEQKIEVDHLPEFPTGLPKISQEKTVVFQRSTAGGRLPGKPRKKWFDYVKVLIVGLGLGLSLFELVLEEPKKKAPIVFTSIRPKLPAFIEGKSDPKMSQKLYAQAMQNYIADTVVGYRSAASKLLLAASYDVSNVKALAMLASCYLNLIDSSNKDENYFSVISKLIQMSRAKGLELAETVIADVEFYITVNKAEAAQNRIIEYTKVHQSFGPEMFFYLAYAFYSRGDAQSASRYANQIPDNKVYSPKIFYLRGLIAEKLGDTDAALLEYNKAVKLNKMHAKSHLRIAELMNARVALKDAAPHLEFIVTHSNLIPPKELARAYYLHALLYELFEKWDLALGDVERAVRLDKDNHDYLLEMYTLRTKVGESVKSVQKEARMYFFLGEGEKLLKDGKYHDALSQFLQARQANMNSYIPLVKIGDMFSRLHETGNARLNYKLAAEKAPNNIDVWSKYINVLIQCFEWEEAQKAMNKFRKLPVSQSAIDKAAGDMYARQGRHQEAQMFYKKAMARDSIDVDVYIAYAKSLFATKNYRDAPFFYALALRFDPFNADAIIGTAKCIANSESIERGIVMLQDELQKGGVSRAELLSAIAELQIQRGEWEMARQFVDEAVAANSEYAYPWKLQAQIYMNQDGTVKGALDKALDAYKSYSDRNTSDPSGYLERYRIFIKKTEFEKAKDELTRIYVLYPKYPNLHYYWGLLYSVQGNHRAAVKEFEIELKNNPDNVHTLLAFGKELLEVEDVRRGLDQFNRAMQLAPTLPEPKHMSGWANYLLKNFQGAVALYNSALVYDKGNPLIYKRMGMAYRDMGDASSASSMFQKYIEMEPDASDRKEFERYIH